jgi:capsular polysaccharide biosynthesis protein
LPRTHGLSPASRCDYGANMRNLWNLPLQRLQIYCKPFQHPGGYFKVSSQASCNGPDWIGLERYFSVIEETIPFRRLNRKEYAQLLWNHLRGPLEAIAHPACVLMDYLNSRANFFHWFFDALPRVFAAEAYEECYGHPCHLIVPSALQPWQIDSLRMMAVRPGRIFQAPRRSSVRGCGVDHLVTTFSHRHIRHSASGHFDAFSPEAIRALSNRLVHGAGTPSSAHTLGKRLYISRGTVSHRRVLNEEAVMEILSPHGFQRICLDRLPLREQIQLFHGASHVIAAHGGALTNLLYASPGCQVLEVFQSGHGSRPDFFQLAAIQGALYSFAYAPSLTSRHDIEIPAAVLRTFLEASL